MPLVPCAGQLPHPEPHARRPAPLYFSRLLIDPTARNPGRATQFEFERQIGKIGHELTHGFDDQDRQFDADGNLRIALMALGNTLAGKQPPKIDGFTPQQRLFLGWGQIW